MPCNGTLNVHGNALAKPPQDFPRVLISIADHVARSTDIAAHGNLDSKDAAPSSHRVTISIDDHLQCIESRKEEPSNTEKDETPPLHILKSCLEQVGLEQFKCDFIMQNVQMCLDRAVDKSTPMINLTMDPSQRNDKGSRKMSYATSRGARVMRVCNIPCGVSRADLIEAIESVGFGNTYEKVKLPCMSGQSNCNLGYGFVYFFRQADAESFAHAFEGYRFNRQRSTKACSVKFADCQGHGGSDKRMSRKLRQVR
jgi:hypothetical protein